MPYFDTVDPKQNFAKLEHEILAFWEKNAIFRKSIEQRPLENAYVFFDGPPFATGLPHYGHILAGTIKDVIPRFFTMRGHRIERHFGWDCHGVPVEFQVEKEQNIGGKPEIEKMGVGVFNELCRSIVLRCAEDWEKTVTRMGRWVDFRNDYKTMDASYTESVWWVFKSLWEKKLIYEGNKVIAYSPKLGSPLSNFEAGLNYKEIDDPAVTVKFELADEPGTYVLAWTTTPWTLPSNLGLAVNPNIEYVKVQKENEFYILSKGVLARNAHELGEDPKIVKSFQGKDLAGKKYLPPFLFFKNHENAFQIFADDFVSEEEGTGIVHLAPTGVDDARVLQANKIKLFYPFDESCFFDSTIPELEGKYFRADPEVAGSKENNANDWVVAELKKQGKLFGPKQQIRHSYPHCWRTDCALMYRGIKTWFVNVESFKDRMVELNKEIHWVPDAIGHKRFENWLDNAKDWAISRNRYWGAPLPIWRCEECGKLECIGSIKELQEKSHKPSRIFVMRHGEATHNIDGILNCDVNDTSVVLTEKGRNEVAEKAMELKEKKIDLIFASPFQRTRETAEIVANTIGVPLKEIEYDARLQESNLGDFQGKRHDLFREHFHSSQERYEKNPHNGETGVQVFERVKEFLDEMAEKYPDKNILLITHGDPARGVRHYFTQEPPAQIFDFHTCPPQDPAEYVSYSFAGRPHHNGLVDLHRPYIDAVKVHCAECDQSMQRIPEVLDCWFESGAMPYGQSHYPFENREYFENNFPADFIAEGLDQTRGWFYTLHVLATALFDRPAYRNVVVNGIVLAEDGQKMSKSKKNYPDPNKVFEQFGVDAVRFTLLNSPVVKADDLRFSEKAVLETVKSVILPLWNAFSFFVTYANIDGWEPEKSQATSQKSNLSASKLDRWILSELGALLQNVTKNMEAYELFESVRQISAFLERLTNGYIRRSRRRFWKAGLEAEKQSAFATLYIVLVRTAQVLAPFMPFLSEEIYRNLTKEESVHLSDFPQFSDFPDDPDLRREFDTLEAIITLGHSLRAEKKLKTRQPLSKVEIYLPDPALVSIITEHEEMLLQELNVKQLIFMDSAEKIAKKIVKPNARLLGPKFGKDMQQVITLAKEGKFIEETGGVRVGNYFLEEGTYEIAFLGEPGFDVASTNGIVVALDMEITPELQQEGVVREFIRMVQEARKEAGFEVSDRIRLSVKVSPEMQEVLKRFSSEIQNEVLATEFGFTVEKTAAAFEKEMEIEGTHFHISLQKIEN